MAATARRARSGRRESAPGGNIFCALAVLPLLLFVAACERQSAPRARAESLALTAADGVPARGAATQAATTAPIALPKSAPMQPDSETTAVASPGSTQSTPMRCPPRAPKAGAACDNPALDCSYVDCKGAGETNVHCYRGKIVIETLPCAAFSCGGGAECHGDQICVERKSGAHATRCVPNPCGANAVSCECAASLCNGEACSTHGRTVRCGGPCRGCP
jgi:hypothetical protein